MNPRPLTAGATVLATLLGAASAVSAQPLPQTAATLPQERHPLGTRCAGYGCNDAGGMFMLNPPGRAWALRLDAELGTLAIFSHEIALGSDATNFDYVADGGQDNLFFFARIAAQFSLRDRHHLVLLYQPIDLRTAARLDTDYRMGGVDFRQGTAVDLRYGFDFYRLSYLYDLLPSPRHELSVGASLQIRNATITFTETTGGARYATEDIGLVPLLKVRGRYTWESGVFVGFEADGSYATNSFLNGASYPFTGALLDLSLRAGAHLWGPVEWYVNLRYLGGGAEGTSDDAPAPADGRTRNWLHTGSLSLGFALR